MTPRSRWLPQRRWSTPTTETTSTYLTSLRWTSSFATWGWTGDRRRDEAELRAVRELRPRLRRLWEVDEPTVVEIINGLLREASALPQLVRHDEWDYHLHATPPEAPLATRMAVEAAMAFVDIVRGEEFDPAADLRVSDLLERGDRPVQEPVEALLRGRLWQSRRRRRLPRPQGRCQRMTSAIDMQIAQLPATEYAYQSGSRWA